MKVACTGLVSTDNTPLILGVNTSFLFELRPGDRIEINNIIVHILSIISDYQLIVDNSMPIVTNTTLYIVQANASYLVTTPAATYFSASISYGNFQPFTNTVLYGGQVFTHANDRSLSTLTSNKALSLPLGFDYIAPYTNLSVVTTVANTNILTIAISDVIISCTVNSNTVEYISGSFKFILIGMHILIDNVAYIIQDIIPTQYIVLNKPLHATFANIYMLLDNTYTTMFPIASIVLVNGKIYSVINSTNSTIEVKYPISNTDTVTIRMPLMGIQHGTNTTEFFNIDYTNPILEIGNIVILQNIHSEDNLYAVNSCYTELKRVGRAYGSGKIVTIEQNQVPFIGLVCFGYLNKGLRRVAKQVRCTSVGFANIAGSNIQVDDYLVADDLIYKVATATDQLVSTTPVIPTGVYEISTPAKIGNWPSLTPMVNNLILKLIGSIIASRISRVTTLSNLMLEFLQTWYYSCDMYSEKRRIISGYDTDYFAVDKYSAAPLSFSLSFTVVKQTSTNQLQFEPLYIVKSAGLPLSLSRIN